MMLREYPTNHNGYDRSRWKSDLVLLPFTHRLYDCLQIIGELVIDEDDGNDNGDCHNNDDHNGMATRRREKKKKHRNDPSACSCAYLNDTAILDSLSALTILAHYRKYLNHTIIIDINNIAPYRQCMEEEDLVYSVSYFLKQSAFTRPPLALDLMLLLSLLLDHGNHLLSFSFCRTFPR